MTGKPDCLRENPISLKQGGKFKTWVLESLFLKKENMERFSFTKSTFLRSQLILWRKCLIQPGQVIRLPAGSWGIWPKQETLDLRISNKRLLMEQLSLHSRLKILGS